MLCLPSHPPPAEQLLDYVTTEFKRIKRKQSELLGMRLQEELQGEATETGEANKLEPSTPRPPRARL
jgi:hypothetical protein